MEALRNGHGRDGHLGKAEGLVADGAGEMDVAVMVVMVLTMADTVFLCSRAVVDKMQQPLVGKKRECAENRRRVGRTQLIYNILKGKSPPQGIDGLEHQQPHRRHADALLRKD